MQPISPPACAGVLPCLGSLLPESKTQPEGLGDLAQFASGRPPGIPYPGSPVTLTILVPGELFADGSTPSCPELGGRDQTEEACTPEQFSNKSESVAWTWQGPQP